ncbi:MAG: carboxypeptidase regulatory-like domain-containing protein, partial [Rhodothermales bacterium]|nr:carboxypeptidase regulatory-like domain-containing protein [Rhodothermales bacterium]
ACAPVRAQTVAVSPARLVSGSSSFSSALFRPGETVQLNWTPAASGMHLKIGDAPGTYRRASVSVSGLTQFEFTPQSLSLPVGVYHANITNASGETYRDIREEARTDRNVVFSPDFLLVVESPVAPAILGPRGTIFNATPTFEWEGIPGVAAYVLAVSSTPFELSTDPSTNDPVVEGLTPVWGALTTETSARYGQTSPDSPFPNLPAPPLEPGREYYFTVLNTYSKTDVALVSEAFGGVVAFRYEAFTGLLPPTLTAPLDDAQFAGDATIRFAWEPVVDAASYTFTVTERLLIGGSIGDVPIFTLTTPATEVLLDASRLMRRGTYTWSVIPNEANGAAGLSANRALSYEVPMGKFRFRPKSLTDGTAILGVRVEVENLDGRHAPIVPLVNSTEAYSDSLVVGRYLFHATRDQFADTTYALNIAANQLTEIDLEMRPLPARISGRVVSDAAEPVENASVRVLSGGTTVRQTLTDAAGGYSVSVPPGRYRVRAERNGFAAGELEGVEVASSEQVEVPDVVLDAIAGFVTGRVVNESGQPVQLARVIATSNGTSQELTTDAEGSFDLTLAAGAWTLQASKEGFLSGQPVQIQVSRGERQSNVTVVLTEQASQVTGAVFGLGLENGTPERRVLAGATVVARPLAGPVLSTVTDANGQYVLSLGAGSYLVAAAHAGYEAGMPGAVRVGFGESVSGLFLELDEATAAITGRVVDAAGRGIQNAHVILDPDAVSPASAITGADGSYALQATAERHVIRVSASGYGNVQTEVGLSKAGLNKNIVLRGAVGTVSGRVTRSGAPIPYAQVVATSTQAPVRTRADAHGEYTIRLAPGTWSLRIEAEGHAESSPVVRTLLAGQSLTGQDVDLPALETSLQGVVSAAGAPVSAAEVIVASGLGDRFTVVRSDGQLSLPVRPGSTLSLTTKADGFQTAVQPEPAISGGEARTVAIELLPASSLIRGAIRSESGQPVPGATVGTDQLATESAFDGT